MRVAYPALALFALGTLGAATPPAVLEIHNDTNQTFTELAVEPESGGDWSERLDGAALAPGQWVELPLDPAKGCLYELEVRTAPRGGRRAVGIDVCANGRFRLSAARVMAGSAAPGSAPPPEPSSAPSGPAPLNRGIPICPGDPRCRKK